MAITNGYTTLLKYKRRYRQGSEDYDQDDALLEVYIEAASRMIDQICGRRFYQASEQRHYTAAEATRLMVDDLTAVTTLQTDDDDDATYETTWAATDYYLMPLNAADDGEPYTWLEVTSNGDYSFPTTVKGVQMTATFGYSATAPDAIDVACQRITNLLWIAGQAPRNVTATPATGQQVVTADTLRQDAVVMALLAPYIKYGVGVV